MTGLGVATKITGFQGGEFYSVKAKSNEQKYRIHVAPPLAIEPGKKYPVIYVLDGALLFWSASSIQRLGAFSGEIPNAFVVGIAYDADDLMAVDMRVRVRDLTPTPGGEYEASDLATHGWTPGGGAQFLEFIRNELKPAIESAYPIDPNDSTIVGVSLGGLFLTWVLLSAPEAFQRYIIISPSIWWEKEAVWGWEEANGRRSDIEATVFITAGGLETADQFKSEMQSMRANAAPEMRETIEAQAAAMDKYGYPRMAEITPVLAEKLKARNFPSLRVTCHNMPDETHLSVPAGGISRGLRYVFGHWTPAC